MSGLEHVAEVLAGSKAAGWSGGKLLGPTFDAMGQDWRDRYSESRFRRLVRYGRNGEKKLGKALESPGLVNPRVAWKIIEDGSWAEGPVMAEYFSGIMACSRSPDGSDDRGLSWASLVARLATSDIYLHYLLYDAFRRLYVGLPVNLGIGQTRENLKVYLPGYNVLEAIGCEQNNENYGRFVVLPLNALAREGLISSSSALGDLEYLARVYQIDAPAIGVVFAPTTAGLELFMWAFNHGDRHENDILNPRFDFTPVEEDLRSVEGARRVPEMAAERQERLRTEADQGSEDNPQPGTIGRPA